MWEDSYAQSLREIDQMRVDGSFVDAEGNKVRLESLGKQHWLMVDLAII